MAWVKDRPVMASKGSSSSSSSSPPPPQSSSSYSDQHIPRPRPQHRARHRPALAAVSPQQQQQRSSALAAGDYEAILGHGVPPEVLDMSTKQLNQHLKTHVYDAQTVALIKLERRRKLNREYAKAARARRRIRKLAAEAGKV
eukprot:m.212817 g.212817  ORF g.212817 m.212817 type:complete len:142 (+) comp26162_c2_seq1:1497-1922(+)